ncbi:MAG TPA: septum formation initiator family protein [Propionicimonas sp.]|nr:septum formation initiator family protein [Propionicimonas sp.]
MILGLAVIALVLSYGGSLQIYFNQQHQIAVADQEIRDRQAEIADLQSQLARWDDPAYVKAQARERLGWVMPGETGYRVVDEKGDPIGGGVVLQSEQRPVTEADNQYWWQRLAGSLSTADSPVRQVANR